jgi:dihydroneopterin aldolase
VTGVIRIRNIEFQGNHGWSADERKTPRRFQVDVDIHYDMAAAMESDELRDTVNYYDACEVVMSIGTAHPFRLLEALAGRMMFAIAERWPGSRVQVELRKLHPPCPGNPSHTAVSLQSW